MIFYYTFKTIIGEILIIEEENKISQINVLKSKEQLIGKKEKTTLIKETYKQLEEYFKGKRQKFNLPLLIKGTEFQKKVWTELTKIPYGETRSYGQIAKQIGNEKASRAVGMANHNNNIIIVIPCHRVIGANKKLVGFGAGLDVKEKLLNIEKGKK